MAVIFTATDKEPRAWSVGPLKMQAFTFEKEASSSSISLTADKLQEVYYIVHGTGFTLTESPTYSGNTITANISVTASPGFGTILVFGV